MMIAIIVGEKFFGEAVPSSKLEKMYCKKCKEETTFIRKIGILRSHIFGIPTFKLGDRQEYFECSDCKSFYILGKDLTHFCGGEKGFYMADSKNK